MLIVFVPLIAGIVYGLQTRLLRLYETPEAIAITSTKGNSQSGEIGIRDKAERTYNPAVAIPRPDQERIRLRREPEPTKPNVGYIYTHQAAALGLTCLDGRAYRVNRHTDPITIEQLPNTYCM